MPTAPPPATLLLVEDTLSLARAYRAYLAKEPVSVVHAETGTAARAALEKAIPDLVLLDLMLPDMNGLDILRDISARQLPTEVVVVTAHGSVSTAVEAMRAGARDFLVKPFSAERLLVTVRNALEHRQLARLVQTYRDDFERPEFCGFIGASLAMQRIYRIIESAAPSKATVFITGESGTGKELCAEAIHRLSPRGERPFIALNCGAIPHDLMESEIFGHVKGAFTGAVDDRDGAARLANGGTLFLDEIGEMDPNLQTKLLRFVQTGAFQKVGSGVTEPVDVRFVCATNRDPLAEVAAGRFREDLYYRLHVVPIELPPLRERDTDVLAIARRFLVQFAAEEGKHFARFAPEAETILLGYEWPGNVRQLQNVVRNTVVLNDGEVVTPAMLPPPLTRPEWDGAGHHAASPMPVSEPASSAAAASAIQPLWLTEKEAIERAIALCDGNIPKAAALLEISASTIYRKRQGWGAG